MKKAFTIGYDAAGNPELLADSRTPFEKQRKAIDMLKAGATKHMGDHSRIEFWESDRGITRVWVPTGPAAIAPKPTTPQKKGSK